MGSDRSASRRFYGCYLLCSLNSRYKGRTYIGFTVNPRRRIRQHNGEITCGAWFTKKRRPWEMVLCVHGFPSQVHALQFEWAWQHPKKSLAVREAAAKLKNLTGVGGKIKIVFAMLSLPEWSSMKLTVQFFSTKHVHHKTGSQDLPSQMKVLIAPLEDLPSYENSFEDEIEHQEVDNDSELSDSSIIKSNGHKRTGEMIEAFDETSSSRKKAGRRGKKGKTSVNGIGKKDMDRTDNSNPPEKIEEHSEVMDEPVAGRKRKTKKCTKVDSTSCQSLFPYKDDIVEHSTSINRAKEFPGLPRPPLAELSPYFLSSSPCTLQASPFSPYFPPFLSPCRRPFVESPLQASIPSSKKPYESLDLTPLKQKADMSSNQFSPHFHLGRKPGSSLCPFIILSSTPNQVNNREVIDLTDSPVPTMSSRIC